MSTLRQFAAATLAALLAITLVACSSVLLVDEGPEFEVITSSTTEFPGAPYIQIFDVETGQPSGAAALPVRPNSLVISATTPEAFFGSSSGVIRYDARARQAAIIPGSPIGRIRAISPDGSRLLIAPRDAADRFWIFQPATGQTLEVPSTFVRNAVFDSAGNTYLANVGEVVFVSAAGNVRRFPMDSYAVALDPSEKVVAVSIGLELLYFSTCDDSLIASVPSVSFYLIAFTPDGTRLLGTGFMGGFAVASVSLTGDSCATGVSTGPFTQHFTILLNPVTILPSPDSSRVYLIARGDLGSGFGVGIYDVAAGTFTNLQLPHGVGSSAAVLTPDAQHLFVTLSDSHNRDLHRRNGRTGELETATTLEFSPHLLGIVRRR